MKKYISNVNYISSLYISLILLLLTACNKWLDVDPADKILDKEIFSTELGVQNALNGIYMKMANENLYGGELTITTMERLALQYYTTSSSTPKSAYEITQFNYTSTEVKPKFSKIWGNLYNTILNVNVFISNVENGDVLGAKRKEIVLGEAYALRAFLHFDALRIFGPSYQTDSTSVAIPYYKQADSELQPLLPSHEAIKNMLSDLEIALNKLDADPIRTEGVMAVSVNDPIEDFYRFRNMRFNYYAVLAMQARILMYQGNSHGAAIAAKRVISEASKFFPFVLKGDVSNASNPDRRFSSELIFAIENVNLLTIWEKYHASSVSAEAGCFVPLMNLKKIFDLGQNQDLSFSFDYRANNWRYYELGSATSTELRIPIKYAKTTDTKPFRFKQPLIRIAEMYYILAEAEGDESYLNTIRTKRGLEILDPSSLEFDLTNEITKEYTKEMYGEGQLFFYYKRLNQTEILDGNKPNTMRKIKTSNYQVPLPDDELANQKKIN